MKILHISTLLTGGASVAGIKIHNDLLAQGVSSKFLFLKGDNTTGGQQELYKYHDKKYIRNNWRYLISTLQHQAFFRLYGQQGGFENFSHPYSRYDLSREPLVQEADIIHLHWIAGFIDQPTFFRKINKPVVWTLHDMNPFLGGFHYEDDDLFNAFPLLQKHNAALKERKQAIFRHAGRIAVAAPSNWLLQASKASETLGRFPHYHVPYSIEADTFIRSDKDAARGQLGLPSGQVVFTFLSERLNNKRKGFEILLRSVQQLLEERMDGITIINIGSGACDIAGAINTGRINDRNKIAQLLSASDALVLPSREDNFPNVMLEANACGCPVIGFPVGGIAEFIQEGFNGLLAQEVSAHALKTAMQTFIDKRASFDPARIREYVLDKYAPLRQAGSYIEIYHSLGAD